MSKLALQGGEPVRTESFSSSWPVFDEREEKAVVETVRSGNWGLRGENIPRLQEEFAEFQDAEYGIAVANGTVAIIVALRAAGVTSGDEVIIPPYTFIATASAVLEVNAIPIFVDIDPDSYCLDPDKIEAAITDKTKAIIPVHMGGSPADMDRIGEVAEKHDLMVIEDAAQAHGAEWNGKRVGALVDMGTFSFQSSKNLSCGEGGMVLTNDPELADKIYSYHNCGRKREGAFYEHHVLGQNYRIGDFQAAILRAQMERIDEQMETRSENAAYLEKGLSEIEGITPLTPPENAASAYHIFIFRYEADKFDGVPRDKFLKALRAEGIPGSGGYNTLYSQEVFLNPPPECDFLEDYFDYYKDLCLPETEKASDEEGVWLRQGVLLGDKEDMDDIIEAVKKVKENISELA